jgi:hypothetical protein
LQTVGKLWEVAAELGVRRGGDAQVLPYLFVGEVVYFVIAENVVTKAQMAVTS